MHTVKLYLDKRNRKGPEYPVKISVYMNSVTKYYPTEYKCSERDYQEICDTNCRNKKLREIRSNLADIITKIQEYLRSTDDISEAALKSLSQALPTKSTKNSFFVDNVFYWFDVKIKELENSGKSYGTTLAYLETKKFYASMLRTHNIPFSDITYTLLYSIETNASIKRSTVHKYARHLRTIYNMVEDHIPRSVYPFGKNKYLIPVSRKRKNSLSREEMNVLRSYKPVGKMEQEAYDYFMFSYYANGSNLKDIACLKWTDIKDNSYIEYYRQKTLYTSAEQEPIVVHLVDNLRQIIKRQGTLKSEYIFPILKPKVTQKELFHLVKITKDRINRQLAAISRKCNISRISHSKARHTFANALRQSGVGISVIQELLNHSSESVTKHYIKSLEVPVRLEALKSLDDYR